MMQSLNYVEGKKSALVDKVRDILGPIVTHIYGLHSLVAWCYAVKDKKPYNHDFSDVIETTLAMSL